MDSKNVIAAISLSAAVIILYSLFFAPSPQEVKKISEDIPDGEIIDADHLNMSFQSKILKDNKGRSFRIRGKGDALIRFKDNTHGIIDYKTSRFKDKKSGERYKFLDTGIKEYSLQLHCYDLLFSTL